MSTTIRLEGSKELTAALKRASEDAKAAAAKAVTGTALELQGFVKKSISKRGTGVTYRRGNIEHTASAPGMPPATDTGRLLNSIEFDQLDRLTATVGSKLAYAAHLEYGTISMNERPFFRPAIDAIRPKFIERMEKALGDVLR